MDSGSQVGQKRHPTLSDGVIIGSGAQILGPVIIGEHARVGANSVVTKDVPRSLTAVGVPAKVVMPKDREKSRKFKAYATTDEELVGSNLTDYRTTPIRNYKTEI